MRSQKLKNSSGHDLAVSKTPRAENPIAADKADNPAIALRNLDKRYSTNSGEVMAVSSVNLDVPTGSFVTLVGPSGCGKSTTLKMMAGLIMPSDGSILLYGEPVKEPSPHIGMMFQKSVLMPWRSVLDNVLLPIDVLTLKKKDYLDRAHELLQQVGLTGFADRFPRELSGGMQQRVAICRALIHDPPVLLLDEPFGALDSITREQLNDLLVELCTRTGKTTVLVTHNIDEAVYLADKVVVMSPRPGRIVKELDVELGRPRNYRTRGLPQFEEHSIEVREALGFVAGPPALDGTESS